MQYPKIMAVKTQKICRMCRVGGFIQQVVLPPSWVITFRLFLALGLFAASKNSS